MPETTSPLLPDHPGSFRHSPAHSAQGINSILDLPTHHWKIPPSTGNIYNSPESRLPRGGYCHDPVLTLAITGVFHHIPPGSATFCQVPPGSITFRQVPPGSARFRHLPPGSVTFRQVPSPSIRFCHLPSGSITFHQLLHSPSLHWNLLPLTHGNAE